MVLFEPQATRAAYLRFYSGSTAWLIRWWCNVLLRSSGLCRTGITAVVANCEAPRLPLNVSLHELASILACELVLLTCAGVRVALCSRYIWSKVKRMIRIAVIQTSSFW